MVTTQQADIPPQMQRWTTSELLDAAAAAGYEPSERLMLDWVSAGLLDSPDVRGLGRGRGTSATRPDTQRRLFLALLAKRRSVANIRLLCNLPVWTWLWWGDEYVPLRQVRRALLTWTADYARASWRSARAAADDFLETVDRRGARGRDRRRLGNHIATAYYSGKFDAAAALPLVQRVMDPGGTGQPLGPSGAQLTPELVVTMFEVAYRVVPRLQALDGPEAVPDALFHFVRWSYLSGLTQYLVEQPQLCRDPDLGVRFTRPDASEVARAACQEVVSLLGLAMFVPSPAPDGSILNPKTWIDYNLRSRITRTVGTERGLGVSSVSLEVESQDQVVARVGELGEVTFGPHDCGR